ncbi:MAG: carboxy-S-adenosyl-L-methionine synthase CmoA [Proteobacteria bacterium]|nr:carboxy-S-adenosyl-L-methionine synthase CmoA [Pseudomonadota bacterium]
MTLNKDDIYTSPLEQIVDFAFDEKVASVFADMIQRSVPGYATVINLIGILAAERVRPGTLCYDLGCSLGAATLSMRGKIPHPDCAIVALDNSPAMVSRCRNLVEQDQSSLPVQIVCGDMRDIRIENASLVVLNYTLQFIAPEHRLPLLQRIFDGLVEGGVLVLSEKLMFADPRLNRELENLHAAFKRMNGYSELEISQKRTALENVLVRDTLEEHKKRLGLAGFSTVDVCFQCLNFATLVATRR